MAIQVATKAPTGLTVTRDGLTFTFAWKIGDANYGKGQQLEYRLSTMKANEWIPIQVGGSTTTKKQRIDDSLYYPFTSTYLKTIQFRVRGCRANYTTGSGDNVKSYAPTWSAWTTKEMAFDVPNVPTITARWNEDPNNVTTFSWTTDVPREGTQVYINMELQSILVKECTETDGSKLAWKSTTLGWYQGTHSANSSKSFTEDTALIARNSYTRWVRLRSRGVRGPSAWRYSKHVYANPYRAKVKSAEALGTYARGYVCNIEWESPSNAAHPIDRNVVEYVLETPLSNLVCPDGLSWGEGEISTDTKGSDKANFVVDDLVDLDECMWLRVNTHHDDNVNYGEPVLVKVAKLSDPDDLSVDIPVSGYTVAVTASNESDVPDSFLVVLYRRQNPTTNKWETPMIVGIIPPGETTTNCRCPEWSGANRIGIGVYAAQGTYLRVTRSDQVTQYRVVANTTSNKTIWATDYVPKAPEDVTLREVDSNGQIMVTWDWSWANADSAEISWSTNKRAWQSTSGYNSYRTDNKVAKWFIPNLEMGKKWYVRVRLMAEDEVTPWSTIQEIDLAKEPKTPTLSLSEGRIARSGHVTASWTYTSNDGTEQSFAEVRLCTVSGGTVTLGRLVAHATSSKAVIIYPEALNLQAGNSYNFVVRTTSASGKKSDWSDPASIEIAEPLTCVIADTSLEEVIVIDDVEEQEERTVLALTEMPLTLTVTGAGEGGTTSVYIERAESYFMARPDETEFNGYEGEAVAIKTQSGEEEITIDLTDLIGLFDDGAKYRIVATVSDDLGQSDTSTLAFEVRWEHQAIMPTATIVVDSTNNIVKITPVAPTGTVTGDVCDIYRLSVDKPQLIVEDGSWGTTYVDPYPTLNEHGGHRIVFRTANGDYITEDNQAAWTDYTSDDGDVLMLPKMLIDFDGEQVELPYNLAISSSWKKDFIETKYLGGSIQGDWNKAVDRVSSANSTSVALKDPETIKKMRKLAAYPGICHVRTPEGSSYAADVQVSESMSYEKAGKLAEFSLSITKVDAEGVDGVTLDEWEVGE